MFVPWGAERLAGAFAQTGGGGPQLGDLWGLGVVAVALIVGAWLTFRFVVLPERARADQERVDRLAAEERERRVRDATEERVLPQAFEMTRLARELVQILEARRK